MQNVATIYKVAWMAAHRHFCERKKAERARHADRHQRLMEIAAEGRAERAANPSHEPIEGPWMSEIQRMEQLENAMDVEEQKPAGSAAPAYPLQQADNVGSGAQLRVAQDLQNAHRGALQAAAHQAALQTANSQSAISQPSEQLAGGEAAAGQGAAQAPVQ